MLSRPEFVSECPDLSPAAQANMDLLLATRRAETEQANARRWAKHANDLRKKIAKAEGVVQNWKGSSPRQLVELQRQLLGAERAVENHERLAREATEAVALRRATLAELQRERTFLASL